MPYHMHVIIFTLQLMTKRGWSPVWSQGEAARELIRVPLECALQEAAWNPYYCLLLARLTASATSHLVTLQYCLWDHFKVLVSAARPGCVVLSECC